MSTRAPSRLTALVLVFALILALAGCVRAKEVEGPVTVPPFTLSIDGTEYTETSFAGLPVYECSSTSENRLGNEETYLYTGYCLADVLKTAGAAYDDGVTVVCSDGYEVDMDAKEAGASTTLVAFFRNGKPSAEAGTVFVVPCKNKFSPDHAKAVTGILTQGAAADSVTDMLGQTVALPENAGKTTVASTYGVVTPFLVTLGAGDRALAVNFKNKQFYRLLGDPILNAANIGTRVALDSEALATVDPDLFICRTTDTGEMTITKKLGIPTLAITVETPEEVLSAYELLGRTLGCEQRAKEITD